ncbi:MULTISPECIES: ABC transporter substrate-binding protein [Streptomyces]|uniref:Multiple sugar transport system substrate-binding protein n=2 Tax=Streptomyces TaxID=1883 RepID=A0ABT9L7L1_STRGD|nr:MULTISPECIES: ABC transporter substrate-binding protein [Streptomyces]MDP9679693.1 multiple sugar transport system substrate-binding protein [Streptomyces griseoviridis]GGS99376.1 ABC transporter substrate-binding protein [Streptomyces griseoviridis]GGU23418.1 ABC transporter substrate-binding protein [Streptomyces daghestanicus]GHI29966.1 ABC transporter substrate-binding protein [Streptomyces daghestanicus]
MRPPLTRRGFLAAGSGLAAATALPALSGCSALAAADSDPGTLVVHSQLGTTAPGSPTYLAALDRFRRENPGLKVRNLVNGDDLAQVYETSRLARKEPDVVMVNLYDKTLAWTEAGATVDVRGYLDDWGLRERVLPVALDAWTDSRGRLRAFPYFATNWPVAYNRALLDRAGVDEIPVTGDQLIAAARKLRAKGTGPVTTGGNDWTGQKLLAQIVQTFLTEDEARHVYSTGDFSGSRGAKEGIEYFVALRDAGVFVDKAQGLTSDSMTTQFNTEAAAMQSAMSSALAKVPEDVARHTEVGGWPLARGAAHGRPTILRTYTLIGFWISPNGTKKIDAVERFLRFMYRPDTVSRFIRESGRDMALRSTTVSTDFPLVAAAQRLGDSVSQVLLPDVYVPPAATQPLITATSTSFTRGTSAARVRAALEAAYRSA